MRRFSSLLVIGMCACSPAAILNDASVRDAGPGDATGSADTSQVHADATPGDPDVAHGSDTSSRADVVSATDSASTADRTALPDIPVMVDVATGTDLGVEADASPALDAGAVVTPYAACASGSAPVRFVTETAPPAQVTPGQPLAVSVTFANCGSGPWTAVPVNAPSGHKLGSLGPQDNKRWGSNRFALPADVQVHEQVRIDFAIAAPGVLGAFGYQWAIVHEGVTWLTNEASPLHSITVVATGGMTEICPGVNADLSGASSATAALQQCIDATASGGTLEIPAGFYRMTGAVVLARSLTLRTAGTAGSSTGCLRQGAQPCAVLMAAPDLDVTNGFFQIVDPASNVTARHLVLDGNRAARLGSTAASGCAGGNNRVGFNAIARGDGHDFSYNASIRALCGTGMEWRGHAATLIGNLFEDNGDHDTHMMWSDGLTIHEANNSTVTGNLFRDNSDVDLILGGGSGTLVSGNRIEHRQATTYAGLMLDNFNAGTSGDFAGAEVSGNVVECGSHLCHFGINLGPHAWYLSVNTLGGSVHGNTVVNGKVGLNIDGAGTIQHPIVVYQNSVSGSPTSASFTCGQRSASNFNIGTDAVVDLNGDATPYTSYEWHQCP
ncbi:MAG: right-handed parallel beta-helix repeat-containing protein [Pseudomonadota bacterium]